MKPPTLEFVSGAAGTGKTYTIKERMSKFKSTGKGYRKYGVLTATTGIAAINLSGGTGDTVITLNSALKYFDTQSLKDNFGCRKLHNQLKEISKVGNNLIVDEVSMMDAVQLQLIYDALLEVNELQEVHNRGGLGLILAGDYAQLPPVKAEFSFHAPCFKEFKITKLEKVWRQSDIEYLNALNFARRGDGENASRLLYGMSNVGNGSNGDSLSIRGMVDTSFDGTTILPINKLVDSMNQVRLGELLAEGKRKFEFKSFRWGKQLGEWKGIPEVRTVCKDAYVMILANDAPNFTYANGSCGWVTDADIDNGTVYVRLANTEHPAMPTEVKVRKVTRSCHTKDLPEGCTPPENWLSKKEWKELPENKDLVFSEDASYKSYLLKLTSDYKLKYWVDNTPRPFFDFLEEKWVIGQITYTPVRLAYASTVHKTQGLSLDRVQIDFTHAFFGEPSMAYVSLSRCRTPAGLTIVGSRKLIEERTNISSEILDWL